MTEKCKTSSLLWLKIAVTTVGFIIVLMIGQRNNVLLSTWSEYYDVFQVRTSFGEQAELLTEHVHFADESTQLGLTPFHQPTFSELAAAHVSVRDIDLDGREDLIFIYEEAEGAPKLRIVKQLANGSFARDTEMEKNILTEAGFNDPLAIAFADFDNDGDADAIISSYRGDLVFLSNNSGRFQRKVDWLTPNSLTGDKRTFAIFDFDRDGLLDILVSNHFWSRQKGRLGGFIRTDGGAIKLLLKNTGHLRFEDVTTDIDQNVPSLTWATGVADFNGDGELDFIEANAFGFDEVYQFDPVEKMYRRTSATSFDRRHSSVSMSAEIADFDNDGKLDVYSSNTTPPTVKMGLNSLWHNESTETKIQFENQAETLGVNSCGWSWGTKAADFNRDGDLDIFVVTAPLSRPQSYPRFYSRYAPLELRRSFLPYRFNGKPLDGISYSSEYQQRNCLFMRSGTKYVDIANETTLNDRKGGRGLALVDVLSDGSPDLVISNIDSSPTLFRTTYDGPGKWVGFTLIGTKSNRDAIGAAVHLTTTKRTMMRLNMPSNGYQSQSSSRLLFGLPAKESIQSITVNWPSGIQQVLNQYKTGTYNVVVEP